MIGYSQTMQSQVLEKNIKLDKTVLRKKRMCMKNA